MKKQTLPMAILSASLLALPATATTDESPYLQPDGSWISLSGTVTSTTEDSFLLDYGPGLIEVEMDDWDWFDESGEFLAGDKVTVYGEIDDSFYELTSLDATSIYVENLGTYFFANTVEKDTTVILDMSPSVPIVTGDVTLTGTVTSVDGREFTINTGIRETVVDTSTMPYNPLDDQGFQQISEGDVVTVHGDLDEDLFDTREIMADAIVTLSEETG
ncbi:hypothetical protein SAMN05216203_2807 [Marinobacter daqiaonensis]|uniref:DUF5666 domain-containing protein n=1 Tax=Marinobacter daqiaonensis TaxID=650891 RepID=A0A1I6J9H9_9GAMM|nr:hypothetical protein [Marinobacter daqiaonensis]SFR75637.1 hypothetical protein SAMN05216203_2807 [Marinobacter daqiaonensis]